MQGFRILFWLRLMKKELVLTIHKPLIEAGETNTQGCFVKSLAGWFRCFNFIEDAIEDRTDFGVVNLVFLLLKHFTHVLLSDTFEVLRLFSRSLLENDSGNETHEERLSEEDLVVRFGFRLFGLV